MVLGLLGVSLAFAQGAYMPSNSASLVKVNENQARTRKIAERVLEYFPPAEVARRQAQPLKVSVTPRFENYYKMENDTISCTFDSVRGRLLNVILKDFARNPKFVSENSEASCWLMAQKFFATLDLEVQLNRKSSVYSKRNQTWEFRGSQLLKGVPIGDIDDFMITIDALSGAPLATGLGLRPTYPRMPKPASRPDMAFVTATSAIADRFGGEGFELIKKPQLEIMRLPEDPKPGWRTDLFLLNLSNQDRIARSRGEGVFAFSLVIRELGSGPQRVFRVQLDATTFRPIFVFAISGRDEKNKSSTSSDSTSIGFKLTGIDANQGMVVQGKRRVIATKPKFVRVIETPKPFVSHGTVLIGNATKMWKARFDSKQALLRISSGSENFYLEPDSSTVSAIRHALLLK